MAINTRWLIAFDKQEVHFDSIWHKPLIHFKIALKWPLQEPAISAYVEVAPPGLEPGTYRLAISRSVRLSYGTKNTADPGCSEG